jgi:predicted secreted protein
MAQGKKPVGPDVTPPGPVPPHPPGPAELRQQMDLVLKEVNANPTLRQQLASEPVATLQKLGFDLWSARNVADQWGLGPLADCASDTCRLTMACGWTVCGKTTNSCLTQEDKLRQRMDEVLVRAEADPKFRAQLISKPEKTLDDAGFDPWTARGVADEWGIGPVGDCGHDTCRLTDPCGWTVCGKTTNSCAGEETSIRARMDEVIKRTRLDDKFRTALIANPEKTLAAAGFDPWSSRGIADALGIGPRGDCASDTCRLTMACGWTVCGKTTNSCMAG